MRAVIFDLDETLFAAEYTLHDGVLDLLIILHRLGVKVGALASGDHRVLVRLNEVGISKHFDSVLCSEHLPEPKGPTGVSRLLHNLGIERQHAVLVSHAHSDIILGKHVGLAKTIRVSHGLVGGREHFAEADDIVEDIPGVLDVLE